jgi:hypothetical protein
VPEAVKKVLIPEMSDIPETIGQLYFKIRLTLGRK